MKKLFLTLSTALFFFSACSNTVTVKYRKDKVDISQEIFEELDTSKSSWIRGAWYDEKNYYMVINLEGIHYHYCDMPASIWNRFKKAESFGKSYNSLIKGKYDCRDGYMPDY